MYEQSEYIHNGQNDFVFVFVLVHLSPQQAANSLFGDEHCLHYLLEHSVCVRKKSDAGE